MISTVVIDHNTVLSLDELAQTCEVTTGYIQQLVQEGILEPVELNAEHWAFYGQCLQRVRVSLRLQQDLDVNLPGVAIILDLLDQRSPASSFNISDV